MRRFIPLLLMLIVTPAFSQSMEGQRRQVEAEFQRHEEICRGMSTGLKRDAFIVGRVVAAIAALNDFQKLNAIEKARNMITDARKRANERPPAPPETQRALGDIDDSLQHAHDQSGTTDIPALKTSIMKMSGPIQRSLFYELDEARRERQFLGTLQARISRIVGDLDDGTSDALGSTFSFLEAGGK